MLNSGRSSTKCLLKGNVWFCIRSRTQSDGQLFLQITTEQKLRLRTKLAWIMHQIQDHKTKKKKIKHKKTVAFVQFNNQNAKMKLVVIKSMLCNGAFNVITSDKHVRKLKLQQLKHQMVKTARRLKEWNFTPTRQ